MLGGFISKISPKNQFIGQGEIDVTGLKVRFKNDPQVQICHSKEYYTLTNLFPVDLFILENKGGNIAIGVENRTGDKMMIQSDGLLKNNVSNLCLDLGQ